MRPKSTPSVRATVGRRSGPSTTSATTPMTIISEKPTSNMDALSRRRGAAPRRTQLFCRSFTSPSMVLPGAEISPGFLGASSPFMPSLKPFTAPPRSAPMLRSFFVPKMSSTMTRTMSQRQMLNEPIAGSPGAGPLFPHDHARKRIGSADDVDVQMIHVLPADPAGVHDGAEAVGGPRELREAPGHRHHVPEDRRPGVVHRGERVDVLLR